MFKLNGVNRAIRTWCMALLLPACMSTSVFAATVDESYQAARKAWQDGDAFGIQAMNRLRDESKPGLDPAELLAKQDENYEAAEKAFREALKTDPDHPLAQADLGRFLVDRKRYREAVTKLYAATHSPRGEKELLPSKRSECLRVLGSLFERAGMTQSAIQSYRKSVDANPEDTRAVLSLACGLCTANQPEEVLPLLEPRVKEGATPVLLPADRALALYTLAYAKEEAGFAEEALQTYRLAFRQAKTLPDDSIGLKEQAQGAIRRIRNAQQEIMEKEVRTRLDGYHRDGIERLNYNFPTKKDQESVAYALKELQGIKGDAEAQAVVAREPLASILAVKLPPKKVITYQPNPKDLENPTPIEETVPSGQQFIQMARNMQKAEILEVAIAEWVKASSLDQRDVITNKEPFLAILKEVAQRQVMARQLCAKGLDWKRAALKDRAQLDAAQKALTSAKSPEDRAKVEASEPLASLYRALHHFQDALQAYPYIPRLHRELGFCYLALGEMNNAWIHFEAAGAYDPLNPGVLSAQGEICMLKQDWEMGSEVFQKLERVDPENGPAYFGAARAGLFLHRTPKELESAVDAFDKAELLGISGPSIRTFRNQAQDLLTRMENGELIQPEPRSKEARTKAARKPSGTPDLLRNTLGE